MLKALILILSILILPQTHALEVVSQSQFRFNQAFQQGAHANLRVVLLKNSGWTKDLLLEQLKLAQSVYANCDTYWDNIEFIEVQYPSLTLNKGNQTQNQFLSIEQFVSNLNLVKSNAITLYLVKDFADDGATAFSRAPFVEDRGKTNAVLFNSVWLPFDVVEQTKKKPYSILAHELAHIYTLFGSHYGDPLNPNILSISSLRTNFITPYCEKIKQSIANEGSRSPKLNGKIPAAQMLDLQSKVNRIWNFLAPLSRDPIHPLPPTLNFYAFSRSAQSDSFNKWQRRWLLSDSTIWQDWLGLNKNALKIELTPNWIAENVDTEFPFPQTFLAFHYDKTNQIQLNPDRTMNFDSAGGYAPDTLGSGHYIIAHEMLHYVLERRGIVPTKLHHCIFVSNRSGVNSSLMDEVADFLIEENISSKLIKVLNLRTEKSFDPCSQLSQQEKNLALDFLSRL